MPIGSIGNFTLCTFKGFDRIERSLRCVIFRSARSDRTRNSIFIFRNGRSYGSKGPIGYIGPFCLVQGVTPIEQPSKPIERPSKMDLKILRGPRRPALQRDEKGRLKRLVGKRVGRVETLRCGRSCARSVRTADHVRRSWIYRAEVTTIDISGRSRPRITARDVARG